MLAHRHRRKQAAAYEERADRRSLRQRAAVKRKRQSRSAPFHARVSLFQNEEQEKERIVNRASLQPKIRAVGKREG